MFIPQDSTTKKQIEKELLNSNLNQNEDKEIDQIVDSEFFTAFSEDLDNWKMW